MSLSKKISAAALVLLFSTALPAAATTFNIVGFDKAVIEGQQNIQGGAPGTPFLSAPLGTITSVTGAVDLMAGTVNAYFTLALNPSVAAQNISLGGSAVDRVFHLSLADLAVDAATGVITNGGWGLFTIVGEPIITTLQSTTGGITVVPGAPNTFFVCLLYTSPSPRDQRGSRMPSSA